LARPIITLTTDFGSNDHFVGAMKGVILDIVPDAQIVDICHAVQAFDVLDGALTVRRRIPIFPTARCTLWSSIPAWARRGGRSSPLATNIISLRPTMECFRWFIAREPAHACAAHHFRTLFSAAGEQHVSCPRHFFSGGRVPGQGG